MMNKSTLTTYSLNLGGIPCGMVLCGALTLASLLVACGGDGDSTTPAARVPSLADATAQTYVVDMEIDVLRFENTGDGPLTGCAIRPSIPEGLSIALSSDNAACEISGTPTTATARTTYTVVATTATGSDDATVVITVQASATTAPVLADAPAQTYTVDMRIDALSFENTGGGSLTECADTPDLPAGLAVAPSTDNSTCEISGTPMTASPQADYTITATNAANAASATVSITVSSAPLAVASVASRTYVINVVTSDPILTNSENIALTACDIEPDLPAGLAINTTTDNLSCEISGIPTELSLPADYTVTVSGADRTGSVGINIAVTTFANAVFVPDSASVTGTTAQLSWTRRDNAFGYEVWRARVGDGQIISRLAGISDGSTITYTDRTLMADTQYYYLIAECTPLGCADPVDTGPRPVASIRDDELTQPIALAITNIGANTYAVVSARDEDGESDGVQIIDITDPSTLVRIASLTDTSQTLLNSVEDIATVTIDDKTYALCASAEENGVQIIDISDPNNPAPIRAITSTERFRLEGASGISITTIGDRVYAVVASNRANTMTIFDITEPVNAIGVEQIIDRDQRILGGASRVATATIGTSTYAVILAQAENGIQIIDISDPRNSSVVGSLVNGPSIDLLIPFDVATIAIGVRTYALVVALENGFFHIIDISTPNAPKLVGSSEFSELGGANSIYITTTTIGTRVYAIISETVDVIVIDITDPATPSMAGQLVALDVNDPDGRRGIESFVIGENTYALVANFLRDGVQIIDITEPTTPTAGATLTDVDQILLESLTAISVITIDDKAYALVTSDVLSINGDGVQILDISDPYSPVLVDSLLDSAQTTLAEPSGITSVAIGDGTYALVASASDNGVQIVDITDPENITVTGALTDTNESVLDGVIGITTTVIGGKTYALVASSLENGVQIIDISNPDNPTAAGSVTDTDNTMLDGANDITTAVIGTRTYALVASGSDNGVQIIDITDPDVPAAAGSLADTDNTALTTATHITVFAIGNIDYAAVISSTEGIQIINISNPMFPTATASLTSSDQLEFSSFSDIVSTTIGDKTYLIATSLSGDGVQVIDVGDPENPVSVSSLIDDDQLVLGGASNVTTIRIEGKPYALVASGIDDGVQIIDISAPQRLSRASSSP